VPEGLPTIDAPPRPLTLADDPLWYKDAVIYQLHVKAFFDSTDDGIGDFRGLTAKLDYLQDLGVTAIWMLPFYPSPLRDDGYDIADYRNIHPSYGSMADFKVFVKEAHRRGLKVVTELVINHTSDQHPWFQRARRAKPGSRLRDFYVWSDDDKKYDSTRIIFLDTERSNWTWDPEAKQYYWHRFYSHQPDLNFDNPRVFRAVENVMRYWLELGVDGMRLDAVPYLIEREGTINENLPETHDVLKRLRAELDRRYKGRMLLAEANQWPEDVRDYFGDGDECHMAFHFPVMPRLYMAVATEDRHPITDIMRQTPEIPSNCQWAIFLRNHDELTLEMVTDRERDYLWNFYAADRRARINLGIRRRLAPLMGNDRRKIELLNGLLFSLPGTPIVYYGDEIGMGDNVFLGDRDGVRTPMQWTPDRNAGFSRADPARLYLPPIMDPVYGFQAVNVEAQARSPSSLLNWMKRMIAVRQTRQAFGRGTLRFLYPDNRKVLAYLREWQDDPILCVFNLSRSAQAVELDLSAWKGRSPVELMGRTEFPLIGDLPYLLTLQGHSFFWFHLQPAPKEALAAGWRTGGAPAQPEFVTLVVPHGWRDLLDRHNRPQLESDVLPRFLKGQRWFAAKDRTIVATGITTAAELAPMSEGALLTLVDVELRGTEQQRYFVPFAALWEAEGSEARNAILPDTAATLRQFRKDGALFDAVHQPRFALDVVRAISANRVLPLESGGSIRFSATPRFDSATMPEKPVARRIGAEQSNSSMLIEEYAVLKIYRRVHSGVHPEIEMARYLGERAGFANTPPLLGIIELKGPDSEAALGVLFAHLRNQGEAWMQALDYLKRFLDESLLRTPGAERPGEALEPVSSHAFYFTLARQLGRRTAEMHAAFCAAPADDPDFAPEKVTADDREVWIAALEGSARNVVESLEQRLPQLDEEAKAQVQRLLEARDRLLQLPRALMPAQLEAMKTRYHGDYHLGQVLAVQSDYTIIDFEGEPMRPLAERRRKHSPLRDVAGMLRSFHYAMASAVRDRSAIQPAQRETIERCAAVWRRQAVEAFMTGYLVAIGGCAAMPTEAADLQALVDFFTLEKALYEIRYELANRPAWLPIPVAGVLEYLYPGEGPSDVTTA
jgi:maltose alpha-D-glucosyltransferase/alpha-amylase